MDEKDVKVGEEKQASEETKGISEEPKTKPEVKEDKPIKPVGEKATLTEKMRQNPWILSTLVLGIISLILLTGSFGGSASITGNVVSSESAGNTVLELANAQVGNAELIEVKETSGLYEVTLLMEGREVPIYLTKDGENLVGGLTPLSVIEQQTQQQDNQQTPQSTQEPAEPILGCVESYGVTEDTIIFYYSNSCGWCSKMKPGVEALEKEGYNFKWIEGSDTEGSKLINDCIRPHMIGGGVPQFICPKTDEIHVGAFTDENRELDQLALKEWVDNCIAD